MKPKAILLFGKVVGGVVWGRTTNYSSFSFSTNKIGRVFNEKSFSKSAGGIITNILD